ncbi:MAG TPA: DoxX family protein [Candidatus Limnocylindria bacterium]|nr:DoxX family protein [Candidatus Limnocylindria bacterium]
MNVLVGILAHVKWFTDPRDHPTRYELLLTPPVVAALGIALAAVGIAYVIQHRVPEPDAIRALERYARTGPLALRLALGISLLAAAASGWLFVPSLAVDRDAAGYALLVVETVCGLLIVAGLFTRYASVALALQGVAAMMPFSFESILEQVHILGIAVFLFIAGAGAMSLDERLGVHRSFKHKDAPAAALGLLRIAMGFGIAYGALTEKLLNPQLAQALLDRSPFLNVLRGLGVGDPLFIWLAGVTELAIGVVVISGQITRPVMAVGFALFTVTLVVFGRPELIGHLPYYGIMLTLFIAPNADSWRVKRALRTAA